VFSLAFYRPIPVLFLAMLLAAPSGLAAGEDRGLSMLTIPEGTPVQLRLLQTISSAHARLGDPLSFVVEKDVTVGGLIVIPAGSAAQGSVLSVARSKMFGIGGKLVYGVSSVSLATGEIVAAQARATAKGNARVWHMLAGAALTGLFYLPAAPLFVLTRGHNGVALKDTELTASIECSSQVASAELLPATNSGPQFDRMLKNLPPRVTNRYGREGDMVNLIFVAQPGELEAAFARNGWVTTDPWRPVALWHIAKYRSRDRYIPMAEFYMFGRAQDYGYALPDPDATIRRRHHIRIWKTQYTIDGVPIWAGAASYDVAIEYVKAGHLMNHTIDPNVDAERDFVGNDIAEDDAERKRYIQSKNPVTEAQTTTGHAYWSDSRLLLLDLHKNPAVITARASTASPPAKDSVQRGAK
jgi:hypothetical protein